MPLKARKDNDFIIFQINNWNFSYFLEIFSVIFCLK